MVVKKARSSPQPVTSGVPQGSVLGPLLFLIYIDDISAAASTYSTVSLYADDAKIFSSNVPDLQASLDCITLFFKSRQLQLAPEKCELLTIGKSDNTVSLILEGMAIRQTESVKDLGVWISNDLKWKSHVCKVANSAYRRANHILRSFCSSNIWTLMKAYKTYVRPCLEYATTVWSPYLIKDKTKIERVQRYYA